MTDLTRRERAVQAAAAVAAEHGVRSTRPIVLREQSNLLVHLAPAPVVARVAAGTATMRAGTAWLAREVSVAGFLAAVGAPVVAPSRELAPGPHERDGFVLSFWELVPDPGAPLDAREAGRRLRQCHEALVDYCGELEPMGGPREVVGVLERLGRRRVIGPADVDRLRDVGAQLQPRLDELRLPLQALHGDAGLGNVLSTPDGPRWNDWEDSFRGPVAWDLACLQANGPPFGPRDPTAIAEAVRGYGLTVEPDVQRTLIDARRYQVTVWGIALAATQPDAQRRIAERLRWYDPSRS